MTLDDFPRDADGPAYTQAESRHGVLAKASDRTLDDRLIVATPGELDAWIALVERQGDVAVSNDCRIQVRCRTCGEIVQIDRWQGYRWAACSTMTCCKTRSTQSTPARPQLKDERGGACGGVFDHTVQADATRGPVASRG